MLIKIFDKLTKKILSAPIIFYRKFISPLKPPVCRFTPTCSVYALEAVEKFGVKGLLLAGYRIIRCNPLCKAGCDPVPERFTFKNNIQY